MLSPYVHAPPPLLFLLEMVAPNFISAITELIQWVGRVLPRFGILAPHCHVQFQASFVGQGRSESFLSDLSPKWKKRACFVEKEFLGSISSETWSSNPPVHTDFLIIFFVCLFFFFYFFTWSGLSWTLRVAAPSILCLQMGSSNGWPARSTGLPHCFCFQRILGSCRCFWCIGQAVGRGQLWRRFRGFPGISLREALSIFLLKGRIFFWMMPMESGEHLLPWWWLVTKELRPFSEPHT